MTKLLEYGKGGLMRQARGEDIDRGVRVTKFHEAISSSHIKMIIEVEWTDIGLYLMTW